jgi:hypothetical protein
MPSVIEARRQILIAARRAPSSAARFNAAAKRAAAPPATARQAATLQRRLGNRGLAALLAQRRAPVPNEPVSATVLPFQRVREPANRMHGTSIARDAVRTHSTPTSAVAFVAPATSRAEHSTLRIARARDDDASVSRSVASAVPFTQRNSASEGAPVVQRSGWFNIPSLADITSFGETAGWELVSSVAPQLEPILRKGPAGALEWLKGKATSAAETMFDVLTAPMRAAGGVGHQLSAQFAPLVASIQAAAGQIAHNDCSPLRDAVTRLETLAEQLITPIIEKLQPVVAKIKDVLNTIWDTIGAPIWDWIKKYASEKWQEIQWLAEQAQKVAKWIWDSTAWSRSLASEAWDWLKNKLGFGDGPEGQDGLLQWAQRKLEGVWGEIRTTLEPYKKELGTIVTVIGGIAAMLSPAGPLMAAGAAVAGAMPGLRWIAANWGKGNILIEARAYLERTLLPPLLGAIAKTQNAITRMATSFSTTLTDFANALNRAVNALGGSVLRFAVTAMQWLATEAVAFANWARDELQHLAQWMASAGDRLQALINSTLHFLERAGNVILDVWGLPALLGEKIWNWVPACIRDPLVDYLVPLILRQIELFQELVKDDDAWKKTKADIMNIVRLVFKNHDLAGAVKASFYLVLRVFNLPPDLLVTVQQKALAAWDTISKKPLDFLRNLVKSLGAGFRRIGANLLGNLKMGLQEWLFGELQGKNIKPPKSWTEFKEIFFFVLDVLGITTEHVLELLKKKLDNPDLVDKAKAWFERIKSVAQWVNEAIDTSKTPAENTKGLVQKAEGFALGILDDIAGWIVTKVTEELALLAAAAAASGGLSEVLDLGKRIYRGLVTAKQWARRILDMINSTLDTVGEIASGAVDKVGVKFEGLMQRGMPAVIGFLAGQVGLGNVGEAMRNAVDKLRQKVDDAILWLIDKIKSGIGAIVKLVQKGVAYVVEWWKTKVSFPGNDGKPHSLSFQGAQGDAVLMVESKPKRLDTWIRDLASDTEDPRAKPAKTALDFYNQHVSDLVKKLNDKSAGYTDVERRISQAQLAAELNTLSQLLRPCMSENDDDAFNPPMPCWRLSAPNYATVDCLSVKTSTGGSVPGDSSPAGWDLVVSKDLTKLKGDWKRMHMITAGVGGPGKPNNLIPAPTSVNSGAAVRGFEEAVEALVKRTPKGPASSRKTSVIWIDVRPTGFHCMPELAKKSGDECGPKMFMTGIKLRAGLMVQENNKWIRTAAILTSSVDAIDPPDLSGRAADFNQLGASKLSSITDVTIRFAIDYIIPARGKVISGKPEIVLTSLRDFRYQVGKVRATYLRDAKPQDKARYDDDAYNENVKKVEEAKKAGKIRFGD